MDLVKSIREFCGPEVAYHCPTGPSHGDELLRRAATELCLKAEVRQQPNSSSALVCGGGAWARYYVGCFEQLRRFVKNKECVLLLPSSVEHPKGLLFLKDLQHVIFCRDQASVERCRSHGLQAEFAEDLALAYGGYPASRAGTGTLYSFRRDLECLVSRRRPLSARDLYKESPSLEVCLEIINGHAVIHTDQLHVAIMSVKLEKETHLYAGTLPKQYDVWCSSLQKRGVAYHD